MSPIVRYVVVRGRSTAMRLALPSLGNLTVGSDPTNDLRLREPGVAGEHAIIYLDHGIGVRIIDEDSAVLPANDKEKEKRIAVGETVELELGARVRLGQAELTFALGGEIPHAPRILTRKYFLDKLSQLIGESGQARAAVTIARLRIGGGLAPEAIEIALGERLRSGDVVAQLGGGEYGLLLPAVTDSHAHALVADLARALVGRGIEVLAGIVESGEAEPDKLLELAGERLSRPAFAHRARLTSTDPAMQNVEKLIERVAKSSTHVLILGETGVGKDVIAQEIHDRSPRESGPFIRVNCVDLPDAFLEEAASNFLGRARGGTVHLDEVAGLSARAQLSLGYLLELPGSEHDVRFLASSNQDLNLHVANGSFRKDLYFRLNQVTIAVPPLRARAADIVPLAELFLARAAETQQRETPVLNAAAELRLRGYSWPGNIRELRNVIEHAMLLSHGAVIGVEHLPAELTGEFPVPAIAVPRASSTSGGAAPASDLDAAELEETDEKVPAAGRPGSLREEIAALEKKRILEALQKYPTQRDAAAALDMPMRTFLNRLDALGIPRARGGGGQKQS